MFIAEMFIKNARISDMTEEEIILEQSLEVPTVAARREEGKAEETCPVCYELFNQIYKQVSGIPFQKYFFSPFYLNFLSPFKIPDFFPSLTLYQSVALSVTLFYSLILILNKARAIMHVRTGTRLKLRSCF